MDGKDRNRMEPATGVQGGLRTVDILGVRVHDVTYEESIVAIEGFLASGGVHRVVTPNPEFVMLARRDPEFHRILNASSLAIPDGVGLLWAGRVLGRPLREHVRGTDLVVRLASVSARKGYRWFLLGAAEGVARVAADRLRARWPELPVAGTFAGRSGPEGDEETRSAIRAAGRVDVLLVAYGAPAQEKWMERNQAALGVPVAIGVGGVFNFLAGRAPRAPVWMRRLELEWLHRLLTQPWRWRRQLALPRFALLVMAEAVRGKRKGRP